MKEEIEISRERFNVILTAMKFLEKNNSDLSVVHKDHNPYIKLESFALHEVKSRRVLGFLQFDIRNGRYYYTEGEHD